MISSPSFNLLLPRVAVVGLVALLMSCSNALVDSRTVAENIALGPQHVVVDATPPLVVERAQQTLVLESESWASEGAAAAATLTAAGIKLRSGEVATISVLLVDTFGRQTELRPVAVGGHPSGIQFGAGSLPAKAAFPRIQIASSAPVVINRIRWVCQDPP